MPCVGYHSSPFCRPPPPYSTLRLTNTTMDQTFAGERTLPSDWESWRIEKKRLEERVVRLERQLAELERTNGAMAEEKDSLWKKVVHWTERHGRLQDKMIEALEKRQEMEKANVRLKMKLDEKRLKIMELCDRLLEAGGFLVVRNSFLCPPFVIYSQSSLYFHTADRWKSTGDTRKFRLRFRRTRF